MTFFDYLTTYWITISILIAITCLLWFVFNWKGSLKYLGLGLLSGVAYALVLDLFFYYFVSDSNFLLWWFYIIYSLPIVVCYLFLLAFSLFLKRPWLMKTLTILLFAALFDGLTLFAFLIFDFRFSRFIDYNLF